MTTREKVKEILIGVTGVTEINDDTTNNDFRLDSLGVVEVVFSLEREFNISISDAEIEKLRQFSDYVDVVNSKV